MVRKSTILPETDGWDEDAAAHPAIRRIHRIFLFFGFFFLIAALIAGVFYIPAKIVKKYPSGGKRVYYVERFNYYYTMGAYWLVRPKWTDTIYDANGDVLLRLDFDEYIKYTHVDFSSVNYRAATMVYFNENIQVSKDTVLLVVDVLSDETAYFRGFFSQYFDDIADRLADSPSNEIAQELLKAINHPNASVRRWAIIAASRFPKQTEYDDIFIPALIGRIDDEDDDVVYAAMGALASYRKPELLPHIIRGFNKINNQRYLFNEESYIEILTNVGSVEDVIAEIIRNKAASKFSRDYEYDFALLALNPETREKAYQEMLSIPRSQENWEYDNIGFMIDTLLRVDPKRTTEVLVNASVPPVLPRSRSKNEYASETIPLFMKCLPNGNLDMQNECVRILMRMRALKTAPAILVNDLANPKEYFRYPAVVNLGRIGDPSVIPQLDSIAKNDPDKFIRRAATDALIRLRNMQ